ncbi:cation channel sperm-associated protein 1 [Octodon degus]|uniref:Cation channel sperm-associated protein 1 n=1 Tax=Octodon degus TaxID=10160 RepID=A0A6P6E2D7_OCTDE|nr:cation channel sperm-associated protein 1 [Octodon degus]
MGEPLMPEKVRDEHDTNNLDIPSHSHSSFQHHRPDHDRYHRPHESHHFTEGHHHGPTISHPLVGIPPILPTTPTIIMKTTLMMNTTMVVGFIRVGPITIQRHTTTTLDLNKVGPTTMLSQTTMMGHITKAGIIILVGIHTTNPLVCPTNTVRFPTLVGTIYLVCRTTMVSMAHTITPRGPSILNPTSMTGSILMNTTTTKSTLITKIIFTAIPLRSPTTMAHLTFTEKIMEVINPVKTTMVSTTTIEITTMGSNTMLSHTIVTTTTTEITTMVNHTMLSHTTVTITTLEITTMVNHTMLSHTTVTTTTTEITTTVNHTMLNYHHGEPYHAESHHSDHHHHRDYHGERYHVEPHHSDHHHHRDHHYGEHHHPEYHHYHGEHHHHKEHPEHHHSIHHYDHLHRDYYQDYDKSGSQLSVPHKPHSITGSAFHLEPTKSLPHSVIQSHTTVYSRGSQASNKVHPQDSSSKESESWSEDEQYQKQKKARGQRTHKKYTMNIFQRLCEKLKNLLLGPWKIIRNLTQSSIFETFIFLIVFLNIIMLMAQTFAEVKIRGEWYFMALDCVFLSIYITEALLKIISLGLDYFYDPWNNLDFFVMLMAVLDFALMQVNSLDSFYNHSLFRILKVLKIMRALRAIRIVRRLRILTSLKEVTGTLVGSLMSIITIFILIFSCLLFFSMILTLFRRFDPWRFENFFTTMFTLFTVLTLDDWSLIYMDSRAQGAWYIIPILMIYIFIQNIIFLNLLTAVLVDNFQMALLRDEERVKQEMTAWIHEKLLDDSLTELNYSEPEEVKDNATLEVKKSETMTEKQWELQSQFLKLVAKLEHHRQKFSSGARVIDEVVDTTFEVNQKTSRRDPEEQESVEI